MSDARQAIHSASEAEAQQYAPQPFFAAQQLLEQAQQNLESGDYFAARRLANAAREEAIRAREAARTAAASLR